MNDTGIVRYLPTPSDRMGLLWTLLSIKDGIILELGPSGTTHYSVESISELGIPMGENLYSTHIDEDNIIMGDTTRFEEAIVELDAERNPDCIFLMGSSLTSVIATDMNGICRVVEDDVSAKLIPFDQGGFVGDYSYGLQIGLTAITKALAEKKEIQPRTFNILGAGLDSYRMKSDVQEICRLMKEAFGWTPNAIIPCESTLDSFRNAGSAALNLVIRDEALPAAKLLQERCETQFLTGMPYGYQGTLSWLEQVAACIEETVSPQLINSIKTKSMELRRIRMWARMNPTQKLQYALVGNYHLVKGLSQFLESEIGMTPALKLCSHSLKTVNEPDDTIVHCENETLKIQQLQQLQDTFIAADDISLHVANDSNFKLRASYPAPGFTPVANHLPFCGEYGADYLMEQLYSYLQKLRG